MPPKRLLTVPVPIAGEVVMSRPRVEPWNIDTTSPLAGDASFSLRHIRPDNAVLSALIDDLIKKVRRDDRARRTLGLHLLGIYLGPENVLEDRGLSRRDVTRAVGQGSFERYVREGAMKAGGADLDTELVEFMTGMPYPEVQSRWGAVVAIEDELIELATECFRHASRTAFANGRSFPLKIEDAHRVRQLILRRYKGDKFMLRVHAFRYANCGETVVDIANRATLKALRSSSNLSPAEARLFEFLYLRQSLTRRRARFDGILGYRPSLASALWLSGNTLGQLVAACFERAPFRGPATGLDVGLRQQLVGLIRATKYLFETMRCDKKEEIATWRAHNPGHQRVSRSQVNTTRAAALLPWLSHLSTSRRHVVEQLANGMTVSELANEQGHSHTAIQNALRRSEERIRMLTRR